MIYQITILPRAQRELRSLPADAYPRVKAALFSLQQDPRPTQSTKMIARKAWRLREGDYRVIYEIDDQAHTVTVLHIGHRRDVYR